MLGESDGKRSRVRTFVEDLDSNLVALAFATNDVLSRDLEVIKIESASGASTNAKLLLFLCYLNTHVPCGDETSYALIACT